MTLALRGGGLEPDTAFELVGPTGEVITTTGVIGLDTTQVEATFNLTGRARGAYAARVKGPAGTATLPDAVEVVAGVAPGVWANLVGPSVIRTGREAVYQVQYGNSGNVDAPMTQVDLTVPHGLTIQGYDGVDGAYVVQGADADNLSLSTPLLRPGETQALTLRLSAAAPGSTELDLSVQTTPYDFGSTSVRFDPAEITTYDVLAATAEHVSFIQHVSKGGQVRDSSFDLLITPGQGPLTPTMVYTEDLVYAYWTFTTTLRRESGCRRRPRPGAGGCPPRADPQGGDRATCSRCDGRAAGTPEDASTGAEISGAVSPLPVPQRVRHPRGGRSPR